MALHRVGKCECWESSANNFYDFGIAFRPSAVFHDLGTCSKTLESTLGFYICVYW